MVVRRTMLALGMAGAALMLEIMQPSAVITAPLLLASLFLIVYAILPDKLRVWTAHTGAASPYLLGGLDRIDAFFAKITAQVEGPAGAKTVYDPEIASTLQEAYERGASLYDARSEMGDRNWMPEMERWVGETTEFLSGAISDDAYLFKTNCAKPGSNRPTELEAKVQVLRQIVAKYLSRKKED